MTTNYGRPFDVKSAYGEVHGGSLFAFEQGGQLYNAHKQPVDGTGKLMPLPPVKEAPPPPAPVAKPAVDPSLLAAQDLDEAPIEDTLDLKAWALNEVVATWPLLRAEVARQLDVVITSKDQAREAISKHFNLGLTV